MKLKRKKTSPKLLLSLLSNNAIFFFLVLGGEEWHRISLFRPTYAFLQSSSQHTTNKSTRKINVRPLVALHDVQTPLVDHLLDQVKNEQLNGPSIASAQEINQTLQQLISIGPRLKTIEENIENTTSTVDQQSRTPDFDSLIGYYNVTYTLPSRVGDNPVGGKWTRGGSTKKLWEIKRTLQHILPFENADDNGNDKDGSSTVISPTVATVASTKKNAVAQAINVIRVDLFFGLLPLWILLRGDAVPLTEEERANKDQTTSVAIDNKKEEKRTNKTKSPKIIAGLSPFAVRAYFDRPKIALGQRPGRRLAFRFGPTSSVVLDAPYVDQRIRIGKGGTSGTLFVFSRLSEEDDLEGTSDWKWMLDEKQSFITKRKAAIFMIFYGVMSGFLATTTSVVRHLFLRRFGQINVVASLLGLLWIAIGTGGIETRSDTYSKGVQDNKG